MTAQRSAPEGSRSAPVGVRSAAGRIAVAPLKPPQSRSLPHVLAIRRRRGAGNAPIRAERRGRVIPAHCRLRLIRPRLNTPCRARARPPRSRPWAIRAIPTASITTCCGSVAWQREKAYSERTVENREAALRPFIAWCAERGLDPAAGDHQADPGTLSAPPVPLPQGQWRAALDAQPACEDDAVEGAVQVARARAITSSTIRRASWNCRAWRTPARATCSMCARPRPCWPCPI